MAKKVRNSKSNILCSILEGESDGCRIDFFGYTHILWMVESSKHQAWSQIWKLSKVFNGVALQLFKGLVEVEVTPSNFSAGAGFKQPQDLRLFQIPRNDQTFVTFGCV